MLRPAPKEKERRRVLISEELRAALREVHDLIVESKHDPDQDISFEDAIQCECLVGGRVGSARRPFVFSYFPNGDRSKNSCWTLALHPLEIEDIADGCTKELSLYCCKTTNCYHQTTDPQALCECDYVNDPYVGNIRLSDTVNALRRIGVTGITRNSSLEQIIEVLGDPHEAGGGEKPPKAAYINRWIRYLRGDSQLRFEFQKSGALRAISIHNVEAKND